MTFDSHQFLTSDHSREPFEHCSVCGESIVGKTYIVEKAYKRNYVDRELITVFELVVCDPCRLQMNQDISNESKSNIQQFITEKTTVIENRLAETQTSQSKQQARCIITEKPVEDCDEFQVVFIHQPNFHSQFPMFISDDAIEMYQALLSDHTKGFFDDFMDNIGGLPPALEDLFNSKKTLLML